MHPINENVVIDFKNSFTSIFSLNTIKLAQMEPDWETETNFKTHIEIKNNHRIEMQMDSFDNLNDFVEKLPTVVKEAALSKKRSKNNI